MTNSQPASPHLSWLEKLIIVWIDPRKTGRISLAFSILLDFAFIITKLSDGFYHHKAWPIAVGVYYFALFFIRVMLFRALNLDFATKNTQETSTKIVRKATVLILILNLILSVMIVQMISSRVIVEYHVGIAILDGFYLGYRITIAIFNAINYSHHDHGIVLTTIKYINLIAAMVAILMTQTTILMSLGERDFNLMRILNGASGTIVIAVIIWLSVNLLKRTRKPHAVPKP